MLHSAPVDVVSQVIDEVEPAAFRVPIHAFKIFEVNVINVIAFFISVNQV